MIILIENCSLYSLNRMWRRRKNSLTCLFIPGTIWPTWSHNHSWNFLCCWNESLLLCYNSIIVFLNLMLDSMWKIASSTIICVFICRWKMATLWSQKIWKWRSRNSDSGWLNFKICFLLVPITQYLVCFGRIGVERIKW